MHDQGHHVILIGLGSNTAPGRWVPQALRRLRVPFPDLRVSTLYLTRPLGEADQPPYVNGVLAASTALALPAVRAVLRAVEADCGRRRDPQRRFAPRTMDLDLLAYGDRVEPAEDLPARELLERDFCLVPAAEVQPDWVHPLEGRALADLARERFPSCPNILGPADMPL